MTQVAVLAHSGKVLDGGLDQLRSTLMRRGISDPIWFEVAKSRKAPKRARQALEAGADLVFVWGGDGMVQRSIDALAGSGTSVAVIPAGTANLLASNLGIPRDLERAVDIGIAGHRRMLDVGFLNGERFAVMAGAGFDAKMIRDADDGLKARAGKLAYVWTGARNLDVERVRMRVEVDGHRWFDGKASCVLLGNVGTVSGGLTAFRDARPDDGLLEVGIVTADGPYQWTRVLARMVAGRVESSKFTRHTRGRTVDVRFRSKLAYELDGGDRPATKHLRARIEPGAIAVCVDGDTRP